MEESLPLSPALAGEAAPEPSPVFPFHVQLSRTDYYTCLIVAAAVAAIVITGIFRKRGRQKRDR